MANPFVPRVGGILSADIAVPEHERELRFYSRVLGTGENPLWRDDLMNNRGTPIIGLGQRTPELDKLPLSWMPHIMVEDVAASAARAVELGGRELMHGKDEQGNSQWAVLTDRDDAAFGIIPVCDPPEGAVPDDPNERVGRIAWCDLTVPDASASRDFYTQVIGWTVHDVSMDGGNYSDYAMLGGDGEAAGGVCHARGVNTGLPQVWMLYLPVDDLDESLRRVEEEGGKIVKTTNGDDGKAKMAVVQDPVGVFVTLMAE